MIIRNADPGDLEDIQRLMSTYFLDMDDLSAEDFLVAQVGDRILGCIAVVERTCPEIHSIAVHPNHRGTGLGSKLVRHVLSIAPGQWDMVYVRTTSAAFFGKMGFSTLPDIEKKRLWDDCASCSSFEGCRQSVMGIALKIDQEKN